uniref:RING-type E3 ubiquitin transferase n=1 Tax=Aceria tosichella TaxID=561515 RepID=A0A6G1SJ38_9ACAR
MGLTISRLYLDIRHFRRRRSQQDESMHGYSMNKNYFCNYFYMGGERFEANDPNYLFGDNCDLNFLTCTKPYSIPYKKAQQNLLSNLNMKQKAINKVSSRMSSLSSPLNILTGRHRQISQSHKQDAQTQTLNHTKGISSGPEPSQPLVMLVHIRKETLRLIKTSNIHNIDSDQNSPTNTASISNATPMKVDFSGTASDCVDGNHLGASAKVQAIDTNKNDRQLSKTIETDKPTTELNRTAHYSKIQRDSDSSSLSSNSSSSAHSTLTSRSGYTSVRDVPPSDCASDENDECYQDALNEPTANVSTNGADDDNESVKVQQQTSHDNVTSSTKEGYDIRITIDPDTDQRNDESKQLGDISQKKALDKFRSDKIKNSAGTESKVLLTRLNPGGAVATAAAAHGNTVEKVSNEAKRVVPDQVYNIEFMFDSEVDCSIRVFYFCTRDVTSNNVSYKPQHATYKSKTYTYKKGLNQKFQQPEHTFQPYLFDEDLLIYKPLDLDGNYNSGAVFPIVIHCAALEGPTPRQSQSLVATVEKSQLDDSYSIKPLKQLLFVDGVQYILQDIYGIENKSILTSHNQRRSSMRTRLHRNLRSSSGSLYSHSNMGSNLNLSDTASIASVIEGDYGENRDSLTGTTQHRSFVSENTFECVICMSDERDTMLLPCRHLCLCSSCAQSLRYQANSCPICRCPFKAALNIRVIQREQYLQPRSWSNSEASTDGLAIETFVKGQAAAPVASAFPASQNNPETSGTSHSVHESSCLEMRTMNSGGKDKR